MAAVGSWRPGAVDLVVVANSVAEAFEWVHP
jgi:hypothetical protein